jgi:hypothetical protein
MSEQPSIQQRLGGISGAARGAMSELDDMLANNSPTLGEMISGIQRTRTILKNMHGVVKVTATEDQEREDNLEDGLDERLAKQYQAGQQSGIEWTIRELMDRAAHCFKSHEDEEAMKYREIAEGFQKQADGLR